MMLRPRTPMKTMGETKTSRISLVVEDYFQSNIHEFNSYFGLIHFKMATKVQSTIQENLCILYLRLNGYLTTGLILHDRRENKQKGEIDILAIRFPFHSQDETEHNSSPYLEVPTTIDCIIGEVKSRGIPLHFNDNLSSQNEIEGWEKLLKWFGFIPPANLERLARLMNHLVLPIEGDTRSTFLTHVEESAFGQLFIRPILFSPERITPHNEPKFVHWTEINKFIWECLCPISGSRDFCGTRYDFDLWGVGLKEIVRAYKRRQKIDQKFEDIKDLYEELKNG